MKNETREVNLSLNSIFVLESLNDNEAQTGKQLYDNILVEFENNIQSFKGKIYHKQIGTKHSFIEYLKHILNKVNNENHHPVIHIECHGSDDGEGLILSPNSEFISWYEIGEVLRDINIIMKNTLILTLGVCHGINLQRIIELDKRAPFYSLIAPLDEVYGDEIIEGYVGFYSYLCYNKDFISGVIKIKENAKFGIFGPEFALKVILDLLIKTFNPEKRFREIELERNQRGLSINELQLLPHLEKEKEEILSKTYNKFLMLDIYPELKNRYPTLEEYLNE